MDKSKFHPVKVGDMVIAKTQFDGWIIGTLEAMQNFGVVRDKKSGNLFISYMYDHIADGLRVADQMQAEANAIGQVIRQVFDEMEKFNERGEK